MTEKVDDDNSTAKDDGDTKSGVPDSSVLDESLYDVDWAAFPSSVRDLPIPVEPPKKTDDDIRATLALRFSWMLFGTLLFALVSAMAGWHWANVKDALQLLLPAETALLGSAVGFYFGSTKKRD